MASLDGGVGSGGGSNPLKGLNRAPVVPFGWAEGPADPACRCRVGVALTSCLLVAGAGDGGVLSLLGGGALTCGTLCAPLS